MKIFCLVPTMALLGQLGSALKFPYLPVIAFNLTQHQLLTRDTGPNQSGFLFNKGGCKGERVYGSYNTGPITCANLVDDQPWDSIVTNLGSNLDVFFFAGPDCCTTAANYPCTINKGPLDMACTTSAGPTSNTGNGFAKSILVANKGYNGANGPASRSACAAPGGSLACPTCNAAPQKRAVAEAGVSRSIADCNAARNCETWINPKTGRTQIRFKKDMGPASAWYNRNVRPFDPWYTVRDTISPILDGSLVKRGTGCTDVHYNADRGNETTVYGDQNPSDDVIESARTHCGISSCQDQSWTMHTYFPKHPTDVYFAGGTIEIEGDGQWDGAKQRGYFVDALKLHGKNSTAQYLSLSASRYDYGPHPAKYYYTGTKYLDINRYVPSAIEGENVLTGFISLRIHLKQSKADSCKIATTFISAVAAEVSVIGAGFFGGLLGLACDTF